jgi:hypothetical protein
MWFAFEQPPYGTFDAAEWAPSTASEADIRSSRPLFKSAPAISTLAKI